VSRVKKYDILVDCRLFMRDFKQFLNSTSDRIIVESEAESFDLNRRFSFSFSFSHHSALKEKEMICIH